MAAGLGFKTFAVGEVLSAANVNGYLMQGVLVFASAAARDAAITSPQEGQFAYTKDTNGLWYYDGATWVASGATGDIEGVTAGTGISGGGTSGTVTVTNSMATAIDAKGDLVVGTGADAFSRLAVGTNDYVLTADSAQATGLKWAAAASGGGTWQNYTPTYTNFTAGNATITARYTQTGKLVTVFFSVIFGSTSSISGTPNVSLPTNTVAGFEEMLVVFGKIEDVGTAFLVGGCMIAYSTQTFRWQFFPTNGNYLASDNVSATAPMTWTTGDKFSTTFTYEAA